MRSEFMQRMVCGTVAAAGIVAALATATGPADQADQAVHVDRVGYSVPVGEPGPPPPPPPNTPPPNLHGPGDADPGTGQHDRPPPPAPAEPNENAICQDVMGVPLPAGCHDPANDV